MRAGLPFRKEGTLEARCGVNRRPPDSFGFLYLRITRHGGCFYGDDLRDALSETADAVSYDYPVGYEKQIHELIANRDRDGALALINELLGCIFLSKRFDVVGMKARLAELSVILSRAAVDAGGSLQDALRLNDKYIGAIIGCKDAESLERVSSEALHSFTDGIFDLGEIKLSDSVRNAVRFMREHVGEKISVDDVCRHVFLSRSSFCRIFKAQTGKSIADYINYIKVEYARKLLDDRLVPLIDVSMLSGFADQSYFTKVFKKYTGTTPKQYRERG